MRKLLLLVTLAFAIGSCTVVRDTTPCNNSTLLSLTEKEDLTQEEAKLLDSLNKRCVEYNEYKRNNPSPEDEHQSAGWLGVGVVILSILAFLYFGGLFG
jgi:hypothetical protein